MLFVRDGRDALCRHALRAGDHILAGSDVYGGTYRLLHKLPIAPTSESTSYRRRTSKLSKPLSARIREWSGSRALESADVDPGYSQDRPANETTRNSAGRRQYVCVTGFSPPDRTGADIVMHSATKYLGGHSDCLAGVLVAANDQLRNDLYFVQNATGAVLGPFESFLLARGLKTLELRVREQSRSALAIAEWLMHHPCVTRVLYPGLKTHPGYEVAVKQMDGAFGGMISFEIDGDYQATKESLRINQALWLGGEPRSRRIAHRAACFHVTRQLRCRRSCSIRHSRFIDPRFDRPRRY